MNLEGSGEPQSEDESSNLLYIGFNQDQACFACGTESGFRIYNCDPFKETFRREWGSGGIGLVEMLFRCNILALVGGGKNPKYPPNKVMIWDDHQSRCIGELSFRHPVKAVKLRRDRIVVVLEHRIYVYNFADLKLLHQIETVSNPKGLCALCPDTQNIVLACPGVHRGHIRIELYDTKKTNFIAAHETALSAMVLNSTGTRLCTSSEKGTLLRIFDTHDSQLLQELRRGADRAEIYSMCFSADTRFVSVSSDKGTIHIFRVDGGEAGGGDATPVAAEPAALADQEDDDSKLNKKSNFSFMKGILPKYFSSEWSFAQFPLRTECKTLCAFGADRNSFVVVTANGEFYKCTFDPEKGGECKAERYDKFLDETPAALVDAPPA